MADGITNTSSEIPVSRRATAAIRISLDQGLEDLERIVRSRETVSSGGPDRMQIDTMARASNGSPNGAAPRGKTAAGESQSLGGSQLQTGLDRGDYDSQQQAVAAQAEETRRTPVKDKDMGGNQTQSIRTEYDDADYKLAARRRLAAFNTLAPFISQELQDKLRKEAIGEMGEPLGGEPNSIAQARGGAEDPAAPGAGDPAGAVDDPVGAPAPMPGSDLASNLQEIVRQRAEDLQKAKQDVATKQEVLDQVQQIAQQVTVGPELAGGKSAARRPAAAPAPRAVVAGDKNQPAVKPGGGKMGADRFSFEEHSYGDIPDGDADDTLAAQARASKDKAEEGSSMDAPSDRTSQRDAGSYPLGGARMGGRPTQAQRDTDMSAYDLPAAPARKAPAPRAAQAAAPAKKTAKDELQPGPATDMHGTYSGDDAGDLDNDDIADGTTPTLESDETKKVVSDANSEMGARSSESQKGSVTGQKMARLFSANERQNLKVELAAIDDARDNLTKRAGQARQLLVHGDEVSRLAGERIARLKQWGDALGAALKRDEDPAGVPAEKCAKIRASVVSAANAGRRETSSAGRESDFIGAAVIEARRAREREARIDPAFALAVRQVQARMMTIEELPAKVAEYAAMDRKTFETVARTVEEVGSRVHEAVKTARLGGRLPSVGGPGIIPEGAPPKDELAGMFDRPRR